MKVRQLIIVILLVSTTTFLSAQQNVTTFGFVLKPIFPSKYFRTGPIDFSVKNIDFKLTQQSGFSFGGVIRKGVTKSLSIEAGLNFVKRIYKLDITDSTFTGKSDFKIIGYEIPLQALVFIQLSQDIWMNVALGPSIDVFPSDVSTNDDYFVQYSERNSRFKVFNAGLLANIGWEWRTKKKGYFYLGSCYHRSFNDVYTSTIGFIRDPNATKAYAQGSTGLSGDYLTFDLRYYFYEDPTNKSRVRK